MGKLDEASADKLRTLTVEVLLEIRRAYLMTPGANQLKNWDLLSSRLKISARTATNAGHWVTLMLDRMAVTSAPGMLASHAYLDLVSEIGERDVFRQWRQMTRDEWGLLIAKARLCAEQRKEERDSK